MATAIMLTLIVAIFTLVSLLIVYKFGWKSLGEFWLGFIKGE